MQTITDNLNQIKQDLNQDLQKIHTEQAFDDCKTKYLGRQGVLNQLFKTLPIKDNPEIPKAINLLKSDIENKFNEISAQLAEKLNTTSVDVTSPGITPAIGSTHLITQAIEEIETIFSRLGFIRRRYPEVDTDWYYAEGLNIPKDHPARDDQETFYLNQNIVLTAHTSNGQLHEMELMKKPPIKMTNIGKTYRRQADATHNPMFINLRAC